MKKSRKKVMISGYYGFGNMGDEAILAAMVEALHQQLPELEIAVLSNIPGKNFGFYRTIERKNPFPIMKELLNTDLFISGGGGLIQDVTGVSTIDYYLGLVLLAKIMRRRVMFYAQGVGPVTTEKGKKRIRIVSNIVDFITVRDNESKELLERLGVTKPPIVVTGDPVLALEPAASERIEEILKKEKIKQDSFNVGISIRPWKKSGDFLNIIANAADRLIEAYQATIILIPFQKTQDEKLCCEVANLMKGKALLLEGSYTPAELQGIMGRMNIIIGMRLHSLIFGGTQFVPMVGIVYDPKVRIFSESIGIPYLLLDELTVEGIIKFFDEVYKAKEQVTNNLREKILSLREKSLKTAVIAKNLLFGRSVGPLEEVP